MVAVSPLMTNPTRGGGCLSITFQQLQAGLNRITTNYIGPSIDTVHISWTGPRIHLFIDRVDSPTFIKMSQSWITKDYQACATDHVGKQDAPVPGHLSLYSQK